MNITSCPKGRRPQPEACSQAIFIVLQQLTNSLPIARKHTLPFTWPLDLVLPSLIYILAWALGGCCTR